ncbi:MAG: hypothetical protein MR663_06575 [Lachnospiraceae bacterium]|nr:hypothetical protein [Lachnospiraceae bacterium]
MGVQDDTEKVLRALHVMLAKGEQYPKEPSKVIVDKQQMLDLLSALNQCMYQMQEKYELTKSSRDKAERDFRKRGDTIIMDASHKAEDIYAASVMYMDEALNHMRDIMKESNENVSKIYAELNEKMDDEQRRIKTNQLELKSQMQDLVDTEKYLKIIEERNRELEKQKNEGKPEEDDEVSIYANRQTEIKINQEYLDKLGLSVIDETEKEVEADKGVSYADDDDEEDEELKKLQAEIRVNLDADYFQWKEEQEKGEERADSGKTKEKTDGIQKVWKNLIGGHQHDDSGM